MRNQGTQETRLRGGIVVTGGAMGIGRASVLNCARLGASVAVLDIAQSEAQIVADEAIELGAENAIAIQCDVRIQESVSNAISRACRELGSLGGLVTAAGIDRAGLAHELELSTWRDVLDTNLTGTFLACKYVIASMLEHRSAGSIVCVSSPLAERTVPGGASAYSASKGGISSLVRTLALDYASYGIRVNAVVPGATETALMWGSVPREQIPSMRTLLEGQIPLGRLADPIEIANGIAWLLSEGSAYATGSHLVIDGGIIARAHVEI